MCLVWWAQLLTEAGRRHIRKPGRHATEHRAARAAEYTQELIQRAGELMYGDVSDCDTDEGSCRLQCLQALPIDL